MIKPDATSQAGQIGVSLAQAHALMKRRGLIVLIGDLLDDPIELFDGLGRFIHDRFDVIVFQILSPQELDLRGLERQNLRLIDAETGDRQTTDIGHIRATYGKLIADHLATIRRGCEARQVDYNLLTTDQHPITAIRRYIAMRGALHR